jgi:hypothetical protein
MDEPRSKPKRLTLARVAVEISFLEASIEIEKRLGVSRAEAERRLREACAEGQVRAFKDRYHNLLDHPIAELQTRIAPSEWRAREVDYDGRDADGLAMQVSINAADLRYWLAQRPQPATDSPRDVVIRKLLKAGHRPPGTIPWKSFFDLVRDDGGGWIKRDELAHGFSMKQIQRATRRLMIETSRMS